MRFNTEVVTTNPGTARDIIQSLRSRGEEFAWELTEGTVTIRFNEPKHQIYEPIHRSSDRADDCIVCQARIPEDRHPHSITCSKQCSRDRDKFIRHRWYLKNRS